MNPQQRYRAMASNRGRTRPERAFASALWKRGFRYFTSQGYFRRYAERLFGQPDIIFPRKCVVIFVDGCFWHGCAVCRKLPPDASDFWLQKVTNNVARDLIVTSTLEADGWTVIRIPEHALNSKAKLECTVEECVVTLNEQTPH